jgi:type 1 fimbriae regulatory protein FimB/type 1 fimbriae regulatory protein FimE
MRGRYYCRPSLIYLRWDQVDFKTARLHVDRLKNGDASIHYLEGDEMRWLRQLKRDFLFCSERGGPISDHQTRTIVARAGEAAEFNFPVHPHMLRHAKVLRLPPAEKILEPFRVIWGIKIFNIPVLYTKLDPRRYRGFGKD